MKHLYLLFDNSVGKADSSAEFHKVIMTFLGNWDGLNEMKLTQKELARQLGASTTRVNDFTDERQQRYITKEDDTLGAW